MVVMTMRNSPSTALLCSSQIETPNTKVAAHCPLVGTKNNHSKNKKNMGLSRLHDFASDISDIERQC